MGLLFQKDRALKIDVFSDADWGSDAQTRKSITGPLIRMAQGPIIFRSNQQGLVAMSTTEAEFVAAAESIWDLIWLQSLLKIEADRPELKCDSQTAIRLIQNPEFPRRTKHIDIKYQFIRDHLSKDFTPTYIPTEEQVADFLTKAVPRDQFANLVAQANIKRLNSDLASSELFR